jgi:hypothetical protein
MNMRIMRGNTDNASPDTQAIGSCAGAHGQHRDARPHPLCAGDTIELAVHLNKMVIVSTFV